MPLLDGIISVRLIRARNLANHDGGFQGKSDPYVIVFLDKKSVGRTRTINDELNPVWREEFEIETNGHYESLMFECWNSNIIKDDFLGEVVYPLTFQAKNRNKVKDWFKFEKRAGHKLPISGSLKVSIKYTPRLKVDSFRVRESKFPVRTACRVSLYQDAHVGEGVPPPELNEVQDWLLVNNLYEDVHKAMLDAKKFIYLTGWSVNPAISLLRRTSIHGEKLTIGELLKRKASEGVRVCLHIWDEKLSTKVGGVSLNGVMGTFDEETRDFFAGTGVNVQLSFRKGSVTGQYIWTHHQKTVILDAPSRNPANDPDGRRVIAFVGGLDLTSGRWDTPSHILYRSITVEHLTDFHMPWMVCSACGPREPWHDIHTKVEGDIAIDVKTNFEERWRKQAVGREDQLLDISQDKSFITKDQFDEDDPQVWNVQLFRSIDEQSATIKGVEHGIQDAYINAIRVAKKFIYIENQYFMGGAAEWPSEKSSGCNNAIPTEIANRIVDAISRGEQFNVYVVLPMFPEGVPSEAAIQEMLTWQRLSVESMYSKIGAAIKKYKVKAHPYDYLNFYCLGNRDPDAVVTYVPQPTNLIESLLVKSKRFMIYVHSKLLIADDQYILCGSSNINERSMAGDRDTEICVGAFQPNHLYHEENPSIKSELVEDNEVDPELAGTHGSHGLNHPKHGFLSAIRRFRLSLWAEHTNTFHKDFIDPASAKTAKRLNEIGEENWKDFASEKLVPMKSHLMKYPYIIGDDGSLSVKCEYFPDTTARVFGGSSFAMINLLTT